ncbi:hypothetical protein HanXRQr2_Chr17g0808621 [Helianthus annuus]|uniref:Uncharacterized protein n=1 Tax=Helianthus annuus TaxID=4232 RepID=A0A9K3GVN7_HELAN|nr:hypothetical protein HanXRQr2_Chr17g0808621 [Helianthus annuus]KAJ0813658.1 hypothetical protein HanPSC8_Chr17g0776071 [Helianthus annuus]
MVLIKEYGLQVAISICFLLFQNLLQMFFFIFKSKSSVLVYSYVNVLKSRSLCRDS